MVAPEKELLPVSANGSLALRAFALARILSEAPASLLARRGVRVQAYVEDPDFSWFDMGDDEPLETLLLSRDGMVIRHTCSYSCHNGDAYGNRYELLSPQRAHEALLRLDGELTDRALALEARRLDAAAAQERRDRAAAALHHRLTAIMGAP